MIATLLLASLVLAQDPGSPPEKRPQDAGQQGKQRSSGEEELGEAELVPYRPEEALVCLDRKVVGPAERGLYMRHKDGDLERVWEGEPYDALWRLDRTVFLVERWTGRVVQLNSSFEEVRSWGGFVNPVDVEVNAEGLLVVVENGAGRVTAMDPASGERRWSRTGFSEPFDAATLPDGKLLVADSGAGRVVLLDPEGKPLRSHTGLGFPNSLESLEGGGFLVGNWTGGEVRCFGPQGDLLWRARPGGTLFSVERRADGRTLVGDGGGKRVLIYDNRGRLERSEELPRGCVDFETIIRL